MGIQQTKYTNEQKRAARAKMEILGRERAQLQDDLMKISFLHGSTLQKKQNRLDIVSKEFLELAAIANS